MLGEVQGGKVLVEVLGGAGGQRDKVEREVGGGGEGEGEGPGEEGVEAAETELLEVGSGGRGGGGAVESWREGEVQARG